MSWTEILGHDSLVERFRNVLVNGRLGTTYLFVGPEGIGKRKFALELAKCLLCMKNSEEQLVACDECPSCQQVMAGTNPDVMQVSKPQEKAFIPVDLLIGPQSKRMREGLCYDISRKPFYGKRKIAIIDDADYFNQEGANALLKTLEEPPAGSVLILVATGERRQLATIRSRSQTIRFQPLQPQQVLQVLEQSDLLEDQSLAPKLANASAGSVQRALQLADVDVWEFREHLYQQLSSNDPTADGFAKTIEEFVDAAGKEAAMKRMRMRSVCDMALSFYRQSMLDEEQESVSENYANCIHRCIEAQHHSVANMNQATLVECWLSDLGRLSRGELVG